MTLEGAHGNRLREFRRALGWTQSDLAERAGISRTAVTAMEGGQLSPSVTTALRLATVLRTTVEAIFGSTEPIAAPRWCEAAGPTGRYWAAEVHGQTWLYPADCTVPWSLPADGRWGAGNPELDDRPRRTLVVACCDPAVGWLAQLYGRLGEHRLLVLVRSSRDALELLREGKVHLAGIHYATPTDPEANLRSVRDLPGDDFRLIRVATWVEGIAVASSLSVRSATGLLRRSTTWVGREPGSGAQRCFEQYCGGRVLPKHVARSHLGVTEAVRSGWAEAGICLELVSAEAGLRFFSLQEEYYELCFRGSLLDDPRFAALLRVLRSTEYRETLVGLPGYSCSDTGSVQTAS